MDTTEACPPLGTLAAFCDRLLPAPERAAAEAHLDACQLCRHLVAAWGLEAEAQRRERTRARTYSLRAAAAMLVASGALFAWQVLSDRWLGGIVAVHAGTYREGELADPVPFGVGQVLSARAGGTGVLSDGTVFRAGAGALLRLERPGPSERARVWLIEGRVEFAVAKAPGAFRMESEHGTVRVLGTRFEARIHPPRLGAPGCLEVRVLEGNVEAVNGAGSVALRGSEGTFLFCGLPPAGHVWTVPASAAEAVATLESCLGSPAGPELQILIAQLEACGRFGVDEVVARIRDGSREGGERILWARVLAAMNCDEAVDAMGSLLDEIEASSDLASALRGELGGGR